MNFSTSVAGSIVIGFFKALCLNLCFILGEEGVKRSLKVVKPNDGGQIRTTGISCKQHGQTMVDREKRTVGHESYGNGYDWPWNGG